MFWDEKIHYVAVLYALAGNQTARFCSVRRTARIGRNDEKAARAPARDGSCRPRRIKKEAVFVRMTIGKWDTALCIIRLWIVGQPENVVG